MREQITISVVCSLSLCFDLSTPPESVRRDPVHFLKTADKLVCQDNPPFL